MLSSYILQQHYNVYVHYLLSLQLYIYHPSGMQQTKEYRDRNCLLKVDVNT